MSNAYEVHHLAANKLLDAGDERGGCTTVDQLLAAAQVHATLALAAATRANKTVTVREDRP
jgi:hypothetical protein